MVVTRTRGRIAIGGNDLGGEANKKNRVLYEYDEEDSPRARPVMTKPFKRKILTGPDLAKDKTRLLMKRAKGKNDGRREFQVWTIGKDNRQDLLRPLIAGKLQAGLTGRAMKATGMLRTQRGWRNI